jgi:uncharacterized protein (DUF433 family)
MYEAVLAELVIARIHEALPHLTEEQILAAIEYWRAHEQEIQDEIKRDQEAFNSVQPAI